MHKSLSKEPLLSMKRDHLPGVSNYSNYNIDNYLTKSEKMLSHSFCLNKKMKHEIRPDVSKKRL